MGYHSFLKDYCGHIFPFGLLAWKQLWDFRKFLEKMFPLAHQHLGLL